MTRPFRTCFILAVAILLGLSSLVASSPGDREPVTARFRSPEGLAIELVPEMETPSGILYQWAAERESIRQRPDAAAAERLLIETTQDLWPDLRSLDLLELSRYQLEATEGWLLPEEPGEIVAETVGRDPETGELHVEIRTVRLPARYDIVFRYLHLYGVVDPDTGELRRLVVTIRGWVEE